MNLDLNYATEHGIIDLPYIQSIIDLKKREELLKEHPFDPWLGSDGYWYVYIPDVIKGRVRKKRSSKNAIEDVIVDYQKSIQENPTIDEIFSEWNDHRLELKKIAIQLERRR